jgi:hypothetical protein
MSVRIVLTLVWKLLFERSSVLIEVWIFCKEDEDVGAFTLMGGAIGDAFLID